MAGKWICLMISTSFHHGDKEAIGRDIGRIFGDDLIEIRIVCDEAMEASGEYYGFVCCENYIDHIDELVNSAAVLRVVPSYNSPHIFTVKEIEQFGNSVVESQTPGDFIYGDIVMVKMSYLQNLYGMVVNPGAKKCTVLFRLYTDAFIKKIPVTCLEWVDNLLEKMAIPPFDKPVKRDRLFGVSVKKAMEAMRNLVRRDKIHRKTYRALEQAYRKKR